MRSPLRLMNLLLLAALFGLVAAPFVLPLKDGKPLLDLGKLEAPALPKLSLPQDGGPGTPVTVYRWQAADDSWHFGDDPPAGVAAETVQVDPDTNLLPALRETPATSTAGDATGEGSPMLPYSPERAREVMDKARAVQGLLDERAEMQRQLIDGR